MPFQSDLVLRAGKGDRWTLVGNLIYSYRDGDGDATITVPAGTRTDLASIPRLLTPLLPVNDTHRAAAVLHDYLYRTHVVSRRLADKIFRQAMEELGVSAWKRWAMWAGVRLGGWVGWRKRAAKR